MMTIAQIAETFLSGTIPLLSSSDLSDAQHAVLFARDPAHLGDEPHLRCEVDACGQSDEQLVQIDQALWAEIAIREERAHAARWQKGPSILPLAA